MRWLVVLFLAASVAWPQAPQGKNETIFHRHESAPPASSRAQIIGDSAPDAGDILGDIYTNKFFGFSYKLPEDMTTVTDVMEGQQDAAMRSFVLLSLESEAEPGKRPAALVIAADKLAWAAPNGAWAAAYLKHIGEIAANDGAQPVGVTREYTFGGRKFYRGDYRRVDGLQTTVISQRRGYVLVFNFAAASEKQVDALVQSLSTLQFK